MNILSKLSRFFLLGFFCANFSTIFPPKFYKLYEIYKNCKKYEISKSVNFIEFYKLYKIYKKYKILVITPLQGEGRGFKSLNTHHLFKSQKALF